MLSNIKALSRVLCVVACTAFQPAAMADEREQWEAEILLQLAEMRKTQGELGQRLVELSAKVAELEKGGAPNKRVQLSLREESYPMAGSADAEIAIVEFSDFECPFCRRHQKGTLPELMSNYVETGKVRYYFLDYPLSFHARAEGAAVAAACAQRGGEFWKMHELLFDRQRELAPDLYPQLAADIGLDRTAFEACMKDPKVKQGIRKASAVAEKAGVRGTPAFLIGTVKDGVLTNAQLVSGARPFADFQRVLDNYLARQ